MTTTDSRPGLDPPGRPRADCTADSAGGLTFDIAHPRAAERWDAALLLCRRGTEPADTVRLPLVASGAGLLRAVLPSTMALTEGRWNAYLALGDDTPRRLLPGSSDLRSLVDRVPRTSRTWLGVRIPYTTGQGHLALRAWQRWPHAEAGEVRLDAATITVRGRLYGTELTPDARLEARLPDVVRPAATAPARLEGPDFTAKLPLDELPVPAAETRWELWLRPAESTAAVRIASILDDVADKRQTVQYPAAPLFGGERAVRPCYSGDNDLCLRLESASGP